MLKEYDCHPTLNRTSLKGEKFVGRCPACGQEGLAMNQLWTYCPKSTGRPENLSIRGPDGEYETVGGNKFDIEGYTK